MDNFEIYTLWKAQHSTPPTPTPTGNGSVRFIDYDGTIVQTYTPEQFAELTELPANPTHEGLTAQGWNWSLVAAKAYVAEYGTLDIGQMYITADGKTRIHIKLKEGRLKPRLGLGINGSAVVDWGDNSQTDTMTGSDLTTAVYQEHEYSAPGEYTISIAVTGEIAFLGDMTNGSRLVTKTGGDVNTKKVYLSSIKSIELGSNINIKNYAFKYCYSIASITIPSSVTRISSGAFSGCYSLASVTIPSSVTRIADYAFYSCFSLTSVTIPSSITDIIQFTFENCYSLTSVTIPSSVTKIDNSTFYNCYSLKSITIPSSVTSIGNEAFYTCYSLTSITIPSSVTSIGTSAFNCCYGLGFIKFISSTPATVSSSSVWYNVPTDCIIYVPQGSLSAYTSASNYPSSSTYTYVEY